MNNKTCGECRYFVVSENNGGCCTFICDAMCDDDRACYKFQKPTNGDVIRQGGNRDFAEYFVYETGAMFESTLIVDKTFDTYDEAIEATEAYLNAPAESEGEDE